MNKAELLIIHNASLYTETTIIEQGCLVVKNSKIHAIYQKDETPEVFPQNAVVIDGKGKNLLPGFIDGHIHGANGADVMDATEFALDTIAEVLPKEGTTSFLATTITQPKESIEAALENVSNYTNKPGFAEVVGIHLEGPFIEESKAGAQPVHHILRPNCNLFQEWQKLSNNKIKTITMAPEHDLDGAFIKAAKQAGVNVSAGHTDCNFATMKQAIEYGVDQVTHLCNAMSGIHHRDIGVVGSVFQLKELRAELIADGIHVSMEMLQLIYDNVGSERLILITDAMRAKCLQAGNYELGGQEVIVSEDRALLNNGTLAGSILKMVDGVKNMLQLTGVTLTDVIRMASINPAKQIGIFDRKGSIAVGKDADLLLIDDSLNISYTICRGTIAYKEVSA